MQGWLGCLLLGAFLAQLAGCTGRPSPEQRLFNVEQQALAHDWRRLDILAAPFVFAAYLPRQTSTMDSPVSKVLTVYTEGDGLAWVTRFRPSSDPSPVDPIGLALAFSHPDVRAAYLARPCQYTMKEGDAVCEQKYWTTHRFATEVVEATSLAISRLMAMTSSTGLQLVGYSGGGAVAALVAAQRHDVLGLRTLAGTLDHGLWTRRQLVDPLYGSLNPADVAAALSSLPQLHFVGGLDTVMPREVTESYLARQAPGGCAELVNVAGASHANGWVNAWPSLLQVPFPCDKGLKIMALPSAEKH